MQGGPLSPLLANVLLDDLDKELESRGLRFARYADDFQIYVKTHRSARRVFASVERFLTRKLKLVVNQRKSRIAKDGRRRVSRLQVRRSARRDPRHRKELDEVQTARAFHYWTQPRHLDAADAGRTSTIPARMDRLFRTGSDQGNLRRARRVDTPSREDVFLEAMALTTHPHSEAEATWCAARRSRTSWHQPQSLLASCQDVRWPHGNDQTVAVRSRTCVSQIPLERACSSAANRRMRTRTYGGVGAGRGNPSGYLIWMPYQLEHFSIW